MADAQDRSMTDEFRQGCVDNSYIQLLPNRGGLAEITAPVDRAAALPVQYRHAEIQVMDPFDLARTHRLAQQEVESLSRYTPRRDQVG